MSNKGGSKLAVVKLNTFETQNAKGKVSKESRTNKAEVGISQRVSQVMESRGEVDMQELLGKHGHASITFLKILVDFGVELSLFW